MSVFSDMEMTNFQLVKVRCVDSVCKAVMYVSTLENPIECLHCGQKHDQSKFDFFETIPNQGLEDRKEFKEYIIRSVIINSNRNRRGLELVKVLGLSNYYCKLLSPFLTHYGMDKDTGQARLVKEINGIEIFDCNRISDRAFLIQRDHIDIPGFGRDISGSMSYLANTLKLIKSSNDNEERLLPIHSDGDGHCLVHAVSRALVGRQLFWHPLRCNLKMLFEKSLDQCKDLFKDFIDTDEWPSIIEECDPNFKPPDGDFHGLRNIHIFGLANVLRRPIILLDCLECIQKLGDYSAVFLPGFTKPEDCKGKDGSLNKPICIAWSSNSHNHYIPLVGIRGMPLPKLPRSLLSKVWGMPESYLDQYVKFDENDNCVVGGDKILSDQYIMRLATAMEDVFTNHHKIHPSVVEDTKLYFHPTNVPPFDKFETVIAAAKTLLSEGRLMRCMACFGLLELGLNQSAFRPGGEVYNIVSKKNKRLNHGLTYKVEAERLNCQGYCKYDSFNELLVPDATTWKLLNCTVCASPLIEKLKGYGSPHRKEENERNIKNALSSAQSSKGRNDADDSPKMLTLKIEWDNIQAEDVIPDFQLVAKEDLGKSVAEIAAFFISKHFPAQEHNHFLSTYVAEQILRKIGKSIYSDSSSMESSPSTSSQEQRFLSNEVLDGIEAIKREMIESFGPENQQLYSSLAAEFAVVSPIDCDIKKESDIEKENQRTKELAMETDVPAASSQSKETEINLINNELQYVKVVCSNNQQAANLELSGEGISLANLQEWIRSKFSIPVQNQRIKIGFPPKEIEMPPDGSSQALLLRHGDRLLVENCPTPTSSRSSSVRNPARDFSSTSSLSPTQREALWNLSKKSPEMFRKGGKYYEEVSRTKILTDLTHVALDAFPNKSFSYNTSTQSLELCVKQWGHFEICADLDSRIEQVQQGEMVNGHRKCPIMSLKPGYKAPVLNKAPKRPLSSKSPTETLTNPLLRKGPGFSVLTSPEPDAMDIS